MDEHEFTTYEAQYLGPDGWITIGSGYTDVLDAQDHGRRWMLLPNATKTRVVQVRTTRRIVKES